MILIVALIIVGVVLFGPVINPLLPPYCSIPNLPTPVFETPELAQWTAPQLQTLEEFVARSIVQQEGLGLSLEGAIIAHVNSTSAYRTSVPLRIWRYEHGVLVVANVDAYEAIVSDVQTPEWPDYVFWFTFVSVTPNNACVDVRTKYNAGFNGGRGGNGEIWKFTKYTGQWAVNSTMTYLFGD